MSMLPMFRSRRDIRLPMIDAIRRGGSRIGSATCRFRFRGVRDSHVDRVDFSVMHWWHESQIVFVAHQLRDLRKNSRKILCGYGKVRASSAGLRNGFELKIGLGKSFVDGPYFLWNRLVFLGTFLFRGTGIAQPLAKRNGQHPHIRGFQPGQHILHGGRRRSVNAGREQHKRFFAGNSREPSQRCGQAGGKIQLPETEIKTQLVQRPFRQGFVWSEIEDGFGAFIVTCDGDLVVRCKAPEKSLDSEKMAAFEKVNGRPSLNQHKHLGRLVHAKEIRDRLFDALVEYVEVIAAEASDELSARIRNKDSDVNAVHADANVCLWLGRLLRKSGRCQQECASE